MKRFDYHQPQSLTEAYGLMEKLKGNARYIAGGTDLIVRIKQRAIELDALISLQAIESLRGIGFNGKLSLGSMTRFRDIEREPTLVRTCPALSQAVAVLANPQVRNVATVGGNLCNAAPSADCAPPLMVMDAVMVMEGPGGSRRVPISDFFKGPGESCMDSTEILGRIDIPEPEPGTGTAFVKIGRVAQDIAIANAAALIVMDNNVCRKCRLAAGAVAPVPLRLRKAEAAAEGEEITPDLLEEIGRIAETEVNPITDVRSTAEYRRAVSGVLIRRAMQWALKNRP